MKTEAKQIELMMRGHISTLSAAQQSKIMECLEKLKALRAEYGEEGEIAYALEGAISVQE